MVVTLDLFVGEGETVSRECLIVEDHVLDILTLVVMVFLVLCFASLSYP